MTTTLTRLTRQIPFHLQLVQQRVQLIDARLHIHLARGVISRVQARGQRQWLSASVGIRVLGVFGRLEGAPTGCGTH